MRPPAAVLRDIRMPPTFTDEGLRAAEAVRRAHPAVFGQAGDPAGPDDNRRVPAVLTWLRERP